MVPVFGDLTGGREGGGRSQGRGGEEGEGGGMKIKFCELHHVTVVNGCRNFLIISYDHNTLKLSPCMD